MYEYENWGNIAPFPSSKCSWAIYGMKYSVSLKHKPSQLKLNN